jgi:hypothetical protein
MLLQVTSEGVRALARGCPRLQSVSLRRCAKVDDDAVSALAGMGRARTLCLSSCHQVGASVVGPFSPLFKSACRWVAGVF